MSDDFDFSILGPKLLSTLALASMTLISGDAAPDLLSSVPTVWRAGRESLLLACLFSSTTTKARLFRSALLSSSWSCLASSLCSCALYSWMVFLREGTVRLLITILLLAREVVAIGAYWCLEAMICSCPENEASVGRQHVGLEDHVLKAAAELVITQ